MNMKVKRIRLLAGVLGALLPLKAVAAIPTLWDTAWILCLSNQTTVDNYIRARASQGFDAMLVGASNFGMSNAVLGNGQTPFLGVVTVNGLTLGDVSRPNNAGFAYMDHIIQTAATVSMTIALLPMSNGSTAKYVAALTDAYAGENRAYNYGYYVGQRYKGYPNIIWVLGGDTGPTDAALVPLTNALAQGIRAAGARQPITVHLGGLLSNWFDGNALLNFTMIQYRGTDLDKKVRADYGKGKPTGLGEGNYEGQVSASALIAQAYKTYLAGGSYLTYGQAPMYDGTKSQVTPGITYSRIARDLMVQRGWKDYVPGNRSFVLSFAGTVVAAVKGNSAAMIYLNGSGASATVDMSRMNALSNVHVVRFNPVDGSRSTVGDYAASGSRSFNTGGLADAVILFDSASDTAAIPARQ